jgi:hypothetical protein
MRAGLTSGNGTARAPREVVLAVMEAAAQQMLEVARCKLLFYCLTPIYRPRGATAPLCRFGEWLKPYLDRGSPGGLLALRDP